MDQSDRVEDGRSDRELEPVSHVDSTSAAPSAVGNPNPFWSERAHRLRAARPGFLRDASHVLSQSELEVEAWQVLVRDDVSVDDEHPPYGREDQ